MAAIPGINFGVTLDNSVSPAQMVLTDTGTYPTEVRATATYGAAGLTALVLGTVIAIFVEEGPGNYVPIAAYTTQAGDDNATTLAINLAAAIDGQDGYAATNSGGFVNVTARAGLGALVNAQDLLLQWTGGSAATTFSGGVDGVQQVGGEPDISGYFTVTQPDGITQQWGSFVSPVIENIAGTIAPATNLLRLAVDTTFQNGQYSITYHLQAVGYDDTELTQQFTVAYTRPKAIVTPATNVFTPIITMNDTTVYTQTGLTVQSTVRAWDGDVDGIGLVSAGNVAQFDMQISGDYHFAKYEAELTSTITYQINSATYVTLIDELTATAETTALDPLTLQELVNITEALFLKGWPESCKNCNNDTIKWNYLMNVFYLFKTQGENGNLNAAFELYEKMLALISQLDTSGTIYTPATPNGDVLAAYTWTL